MKDLKKGDRMQLERKGYYIVDSVNPLILIETPDGKIKKEKKDLSKEASAGAAPAEGGKKDKKKKEKKPQPPPAAARALDDPTRLKIMVGKIVKVWPHPDSDKLWCEQIDVGESEPRQIASGLRHHVTEEGMLGARVIVLANLKTRKIAGFESQGMVMCASLGDKVELLHPPEGAKIGEVITFPGFEGAPDDRLNEKSGKAPFPVIAPDLKTNDNCEACFKGAAFTTSAGTVKCASNVGGTVS